MRGRAWGGRQLVAVSNTSNRWWEVNLVERVTLVVVSIHAMGSGRRTRGRRKQWVEKLKDNGDPVCSER